MENRYANKQHVDCFTRAVCKILREYGGRRHAILRGESGRPLGKIMRTEPEKMSVGDRVNQAGRAFQAEGTACGEVRSEVVLSGE